MKWRWADGMRMAQSGLRRLAGWWLGELSAMLRPVLTHRLLGDGDVVRIDASGGQLSVRMPDAQGGSLPVDVQHLDRPLRRRIDRADAIALVLPAASVLRRTITIPAVAPRQLHAAMPFLVERYTPFQQAQARSAWRVLSRDTAARAIRVELAVTAALPLTQAVAALHALKIPVSEIVVDGDEHRPRLDFSPHHRFQDGRFWLREPSRLLAAAALFFLLLGPPAIAVWTHIQANRDAAAAASAGGRQALHGVSARLRADRRHMAFLSPHLDDPDTLAMLNAVTRVLSDDAWVFGFDLSGSTLEIQGFAADLPATVAQLQSLPELDRLEFKSSVIHGIRDNKDRFDILLRLKKAGHAEHVSSQPAGGIAAAGRRDMVGMGFY